MRRVLVQIHLWLGLTIGLLWALQGLTGAVLVFHREIERLGGPVATSGPIASVDEIVASASAAAGGAPIVRLAIADGHRDLINAFYSAPGTHENGEHAHHLRAVVIDAATARSVGERDMDPATPLGGSALRWIDMFHMALWSGRTGEILIGVSGLVLFTAALTGLWVAWPPLRAWKSVFTYQRWRTTLQRLYGWHRALGIVVALFLVALALSGAVMNFEEVVRAGLARVVAHQLAYHPVPVESLAAVIAPQAALDIAQRRLPAARWVRIFMPSAAEPVYTVRFYQSGESRIWLGRTTVVVDATTGRIDSIYDPTTAPLSNRLLDAAFPLHNGELLGLAGRMLILLTGLALPTLYITGIWRWLAQRRQKRARVAASAERKTGG